MVVAPTHTVAAPLTVPAFGKVITDILADAVAVPQGVIEVYIMFALPVAIPVTTPVVGFTEATPVLLLLQLPPEGPVLLNVAVALIQTVAAPLTVPAFGSGFTAINCVALLVPQLLVTVYVIVAFPGDTPVTAPVAGFTVATEGVTLLQVPPLTPLLL